MRQAKVDSDATCSRAAVFSVLSCGIDAMTGGRGRLIAAWERRMGAEPNIGQLIAEIKSAKADITSRDQQTIERVAELESPINDILLGMRRPAGGDGYADDRNLERKSAVQMCVDRHSWQHQKNEGRWVDYTPGSDEIDEAITSQKAWRAILRHGDIQQLDDLERKSLSAFNFGNTGWVIPPQVSMRVRMLRPASDHRAAGHVGDQGRGIARRGVCHAGSPPGCEFRDRAMGDGQGCACLQN